MTSGTIVTVQGSTADVRFGAEPPPIGQALMVARPGGPLLLEVEALLPDGLVRCALLGPAAGLTPGARVADTGGPLSVPVGPAVLGRVIDPGGLALDGRGRLDSAPRRPIARRASLPKPAGGILETGIKVVDLLAPLPRGGCAGIFAPPYTGKLVLITEIARRMADRDGLIVFVGSEARTYEVNDLMRTMDESGIAGRTAMVFSRIDDPPAMAKRALLAALTVAEQAREVGHEVLICLDRLLVDAAAIGELKGLLPEGVTLIVDGPPSDDPGPVDVLIRCTAELAERQLWPAVDRHGSRSRLLDHETDPQHRAAAQAARALLRSDGPARRAELLERYLTQPFYCAEAYTDVPGEYVPLATTVREVAAICAGAYDGLEPEQAHFIGSLELALA